jgi:predicted ATPase
MIVSRAAELSRLDDLLTALAGGEGSALVVRGEAGIGKTWCTRRRRRPNAASRAPP